jgi:hypothetical protein
MISSIGLLLQSPPSIESTVWGGALHKSGLFAHLLKTLIDSEVRPTLFTVCT